MHITKGYLRNNLNHVFVFGDNLKRKGYGGAATLRDESNTYGFVTKKAPNNNDGSFYKPDTYRDKFVTELRNLIKEIVKNPDKTYLITELGGGLANRYKIRQKIIVPGLTVLEKYDNVKFI